MSNELSLSFSDVQQMANAVVKGGLFANIKTPEAALSLMLICQSEGLHPMQAMKRYHIIQGRPTMRADAMMAEFQRRGGKVVFTEHTDKAVSGDFTSPDGSTLSVRWTIDDAKRAGLTGKDVWRQYPRNMLTARCVSEGIRAVLPDCVVGIYTPEEAESLPPTDAGIAELEARREAHSRANAGATILVDTDLSAKPLSLLDSPGVERFEGYVANVEDRPIVEKNQTVIVHDVTLAREDQSTLLVGTRTLSLAEAARDYCLSASKIVAGVKTQSKGGMKLVSIERADAINADEDSKPGFQDAPGDDGGQHRSRIANQLQEPAQ